jgi:hypothetical protein
MAAIEEQARQRAAAQVRCRVFNQMHYPQTDWCWPCQEAKVAAQRAEQARIEAERAEKARRIREKVPQHAIVPCRLPPRL